MYLYRCFKSSRTTRKTFKTYSCLNILNTVSHTLSIILKVAQFFQNLLILKLLIPIICWRFLLRPPESTLVCRTTIQFLFTQTLKLRLFRNWLRRTAAVQEAAPQPCGESSLNENKFIKNPYPPPAAQSSINMSFQKSTRKCGYSIGLIVVKLYLNQFSFISFDVGDIVYTQYY